MSQSMLRKPTRNNVELDQIIRTFLDALACRTTAMRLRLIRINTPKSFDTSFCLENEALTLQNPITG